LQWFVLLRPRAAWRCKQISNNVWLIIPGSSKSLCKRMWVSIVGKHKAVFLICALGNRVNITNLFVGINFYYFSFCSFLFLMHQGHMYSLSLYRAIIIINHCLLSAVSIVSMGRCTKSEQLS
jgi:hypothetical protein